MSLRLFHFVFILIVIVAADMFGAWAMWQNSQTPSRSLVLFGTVSFLVGFALVGYAIWLVRKLDRAKLG